MDLNSTQPFTIWLKDTFKDFQICVFFMPAFILISQKCYEVQMGILWEMPRGVKKCGFVNLFLEPIMSFGERTPFQLSTLTQFPWQRWLVDCRPLLPVLEHSAKLHFLSSLSLSMMAISPMECEQKCCMRPSRMPIKTSHSFSPIRSPFSWIQTMTVDLGIMEQKDGRGLASRMTR